ncbi:MAG: hypothetical protein HFG49_10265 [Lachnospiraceae bacterium]|jgi:multicomponent Na+:H+ antiporter subunit E|nr:hypothetical protein [Lachnospiraceae bacterium]
MYLLIFSVWLILNGRVTAEICIFGIVIAAALFWFLCRYMDYSLKKEILIFRLLPFLIQYFWVLVKEIVKANVCVLKLILSPELWPEPALVYFDTELKTGLAKAMLADSITLTPGTITVSLEGNRFCVHCLDKELAEGMEHSVFVELLQKMESFIGSEHTEAHSKQINTETHSKQANTKAQPKQANTETQPEQTNTKAQPKQINTETQPKQASTRIQAEQKEISIKESQKKEGKSSRKKGKEKRRRQNGIN